MGKQDVLLEQPLQATKNKPQAAANAPALTSDAPIGHSHGLHIQYGLNPLVSAAASLLAFISKLDNWHQLPHPKTLQENIVHEMRVFESHARAKGYPTTTIELALYVLMSTIDEKLAHSSWEAKQVWQQHRLLQVADKAQAPSESFFTMLANIEQDPEQHIELIELIYLCLTAGFTGKLHGSINASAVIDDIMSSLHTLIRSQRGPIKKALFVTRAKVPQNSTKQRWKQLSTYALIGWGVLSLSLFVSLSYTLHLVLQPLQQLIGTL